MTTANSLYMKSRALRQQWYSINIVRIFYLLFLIVVISCNEAIPISTYAEWIENKNNGLHQSLTTDNHVFTLQYKPIEYMIAMRERTPKIRKEVLDEAKTEMGDMEYFNFKLSTIAGKPALSDREVQIDDKDIYLLSGMEKDLFLLEGEDTLYCRMFHFEGANGILPYDNCVLAFDESKQPDKDKTFLFNAHKLGLDWISIPIKAEAIKNIPKMKTY